MTREGDTFCFDSGYHPTATSPGHAEYIFTILVGKTQRSLVQARRRRTPASDKPHPGYCRHGRQVQIDGKSGHRVRPAGRWGEVEELNGAAIFLASDASSFVNGQILYVDGGMTSCV